MVYEASWRRYCEQTEELVNTDIIYKIVDLERSPIYGHELTDEDNKRLIELKTISTLRGLINYENEIILKDLKSYIENNIIPLYSKFDKGHQKDHIEKVWKSSLQILKDNEITDININMVYTIAMFHDIGLSHNRKDHHKYSKKILMNDLYLKEIFSKEEIEIMGDAVEDHRASNKNKARSIYGEIVSDGDRLINLREIILRIFQYEDKYIKLSKDDLFKSCYEHLSEKYGADNHVGYVKLYFNKSNSQKELDKIHKMNKEDIYKECEIVYNEMKGNM